MVLYNYELPGCGLVISVTWIGYRKGESRELTNIQIEFGDFHIKLHSNKPTIILFFFLEPEELLKVAVENEISWVSVYILYTYVLENSIKSSPELAVCKTLC